MPSVKATSTPSSRCTISLTVSPTRTWAPDDSVVEVRISCSAGRVRPFIGGQPGTTGG